MGLKTIVMALLGIQAKMEVLRLAGENDQDYAKRSDDVRAEALIDGISEGLGYTPAHKFDTVGGGGFVITMSLGHGKVIHGIGQTKVQAIEDAKDQMENESDEAPAAPKKKDSKPEGFTEGGIMPGNKKTGPAPARSPHVDKVLKEAGIHAPHVLTVVEARAMVGNKMSVDLAAKLAKKGMTLKIEKDSEKYTIQVFDKAKKRLGGVQGFGLHQTLSKINLKSLGL